MRSPHVDLEAFEPVRHVEILADWLHRPHVRRWWGDPGVALELAIGRSPDSHALIVLDGEPTGYLCWHELSQEDAGQSGLSGLPRGLVDIDICIGEPGEVGRGVGSAALVLLLERLRERDVSAAGVGTSVENRRAIRAFEKAGFRFFREFADPLYGPCWYMVAECSRGWGHGCT